MLSVTAEYVDVYGCWLTALLVLLMYIALSTGQTLVGRSDTEKVNIELSGLGYDAYMFLSCVLFLPLSLLFFPPFIYYRSLSLDVPFVLVSYDIEKNSAK